MPVQLSEPSRIDLLEYRGERVVDRKLLHSDNPIPASGKLNCTLLAQSVLMCRLGWLQVARPILARGGDLAGKNVDFLLGQGADYVSGEIQIALNNVPGRVRHPIRNAKCPELRKMSIVNAEEEMRFFVANILNRMTKAFGEIPKVTRFKVICRGRILSIRVDHGRAHFSGDPEGPLRG